MLEKIVFGCVADNIPKYLDQAMRLLQSWKWFGGRLVNADFYVCVVDEVSADYRYKYESLGAQVHVVPRFSSLHPPSNKLRFLELPQLADATRVILLDCDTIIVQEPCVLIDNAVFIAKTADFRTVSPSVFENIFRAFDIKMPLAIERCTVSGEQTIPYFNAGVLSFSRHAMDTLVPEWIRLNKELLKRIDLLQSCSNFCEQASLSLALASCESSYKTLSNSGNFPAHCHSGSHGSDLQSTDPLIIHYHWLVDENGLLLLTPYPKVNVRISAFNAKLRQEEDFEFNNRQFWNSRDGLKNSV